MAEPPDPALRLDPHALPELHRALDDARERLAAPLRDLDADGRLSRPWLGDPVSERVARDYAWHGTDGPDAGVTALRRHLEGWDRARDDVAGSDRDYTAAEQAAAAEFGTDGR